MTGLRAGADRRLKQGYRALRRALPPALSRNLQRAVVEVKKRRARRRPIRPLGLEGHGPITLVDVRGVTDERLEEIADEIAASPQPVRRVLLLDRPDFLGLRSRGLTFEYLPPRDSSTRWFPDDDAYDEFVERRIADIRVTLGVTGPLDRSFVAQSG